MLSLRTLLPRSALVSVPGRSSSAAPAAASTPLRFYSAPTSSEEAAKADAYHKHDDTDKMQKETVEDHAKDRRADKITSSPNDKSTVSEDVAHAHKNDQSPEELQKETAKKASPKH